MPRSQSERPLIAVTAGEPPGIGPGLCLMLADKRLPGRVVVVADRDLLLGRAEKLGIGLRVADFDSRPQDSSDAVLVHHVPLAAAVEPGRLNAANSAYVLRTLEVAAHGCIRG